MMQAPEHNGDNNVNISMPFGKYRGKIVNDVMEKDPSYLVWFVRNIKICLTSLRIKSHSHFPNAWAAYMTKEAVRERRRKARESGQGRQ